MSLAASIYSGIQLPHAERVARLMFRDWTLPTPFQRQKTAFQRLPTPYQRHPKPPTNAFQPLPTGVCSNPL
jgi:hypothetical protein